MGYKTGLKSSSLSKVPTAVQAGHPVAPAVASALDLGPRSRLQDPFCIVAAKGQTLYRSLG